MPAGRFLVICDFDGTLVDSSAVALACANQVLAGSGRPPITPAQVAALRSQPFANVLRTLDIPLWRVPGMLLQVRRLMRERSADIAPFPGIVTALGVLGETGAVFAVVTNNDPGTVRRILDRHGFPPVIAIRSGDPVRGKAAALRVVARPYPGRAVYVSDEARDLGACTAAGLPMVAVSWGVNDRSLLTAAGATMVIDRPEELAASVLAVIAGTLDHTACDRGPA